MKKEIEIQNPEKLLSCLCAPFMAAYILEGEILTVGFTPNLLFVNYFAEALFLFLFCLSCKKKYQCYKAEPNLKITPYFWIELGIHGMFMTAAAVQSAWNVWISIGDSGLKYRHEYFLITLLILLLHMSYMCVDYYASEKAAVVRYCKRKKKETEPKAHK